MDKIPDIIKELWEILKQNGVIMITGVGIIGATFASRQYLGLVLPDWQLFSFIILGILLLLTGFFIKPGSASSKITITLENEIITIKSSNAEASNSQIKIKIENIENERCLGEKVIGLPVNSEFQDECLMRLNSSAGAYIDKCLNGGAEARYNEILKLFVDVTKRIGSTKLIRDFLKKGDNIIFTAVTEYNEQGIITTTPINISYAMQELLKTARANHFTEILCPVFGSGSGGVAPKTAIKSMIAGILGAFEVFSCNNMTITIKVHNRAFGSIKEIKKAIENE